ncbi:MAG: RecQ family ATP-dependent helicase [Chitinophagaceae bacterium]|nr:RecQ family ATP-dependent helicase [Chitinophagaceae bacterium]
MQAIDILEKYWGHTSYKPGQEEVIESLLKGKDVLAVLPTGGGKSICFQVPALMKEGLCLVISPLVALMKNQVENLLKKDIPAMAIDSSLNYRQVEQELMHAANGRYRFLYVSPERLQSKLFLEYAHSLPVNLIAVDEAHCISQWGYDFRPPYLQIISLRNIYPEINFIALTASATPQVQHDIIEKLEIQNGITVRESFARPNLSCSVFNSESKVNKVLEILSKVNGSAIIYCNSRRLTKEVTELLQLNNIQADYYHAGLNHNERTMKQDQWIQNKTRVIVCTNAFGMGIDKPDVRAVIHWNSPDCPENFYQESGRAGRDGLRAFSVLLYNQQDVEYLKQQPERKFPSIETVKDIYQQLGDYLQIPVGSGQEQYYDFRLDEFCTNFHLDHLTVVNVLKVLEQQGFLTLAENVFFSIKNYI